MIEFVISDEDAIAIMDRELNASREHRRMTFIFKSSPRLYQKIVLRQLAEADAKRKLAIKRHILTGSPAA